MVTCVILWIRAYHGCIQVHPGKYLWMTHPNSWIQVQSVVHPWHPHKSGYAEYFGVWVTGSAGMGTVLGITDPLIGRPFDGGAGNMATAKCGHCLQLTTPVQHFITHQHHHQQRHHHPSPILPSFKSCCHCSHIFHGAEQWWWKNRIKAQMMVECCLGTR